MDEFAGDEIGKWSEIKLDIIKRYASEYSKILDKQDIIKEYCYIDAFSGAGMHISKTTGTLIAGSPINALEINPPFSKYYFIDINGEKIEALKKTIYNNYNKDIQNRVQIFKKDCNNVLIKEIFPNIQFRDYKRGLCILDPYGIDFSWSVVEMAGKMGTIELFINFPAMDIQRNILRDDAVKIESESMNRMNLLWGDNSWHHIVFDDNQKNLFGNGIHPRKLNIYGLAKEYRKRLIDNAGFAQVPEPLPIRNTKGGILFYLFFVSQKSVAIDIVNYIFSKFGVFD